ncbi:MurR/RpiR family transcriptional regulator [Janthinobacterium psychrotolerans]|uniref:DNA-binding transcriptional regulator, MurR/RpiR family n=1 Tax=Janthinobacterium psychrotolerans TaxID=1747903 RepID=A0A1A7C4U0_9BURK|nr:MurR/RpiR family transcriptional regulator [Janthinobacterium psychrotolerans]OBV39775.1 DNA-binding transcriptional regulator, MurR/RpiR family [Janthinobacterium psychrotolerans]
MAEVAAIDQLIQQIANEYESLSRQLKLIAKYVEQHRSSLMLERISDIAAACDVQPSAIVRFAQRFGYSGFSEMQEVFRQAYTEQTSAPPNYQQRIRKLIVDGDRQLSAGDMTRAFIGASYAGLNDLAAGLDDVQLEAAVTLLQQADNIYVVGVRRSFPIASYIAYALEHTAKRVHLVSGLGGMHRDQMRSIRRGDVAIAISFAPYGKETLQCARLAQDNGAKVLVITDSKLAPLARAADALLTVTEGSAFAFRSLTSTICLCQALFIALAYRLESDIKEITPPGEETD